MSSIVILSGSPRKDGNTDKLVNAFIEGAESEGKKITLFRVADMKIGGCLAATIVSRKKAYAYRKTTCRKSLKPSAKQMPLSLPRRYIFGTSPRRRKPL